MPVIRNGRIEPGTGTITFVDDSSSSSSTSDTTATTTPTVQTVNGENIGGGYGIFSRAHGSTNVILDFKTLVAGTGVVITDDGQTLTFNNIGTSSFIGLSDGPGSILPGGVLIGNQSGSALEWVNSPSLPNQILSWDGTQFLWIDTPNPSGNAPIINNLGSGEGIYASVSSNNYYFKSLVAGSNTTLTSTGNDITIDSLGEANIAANLGSGVDVFSDKSGVTLNFRSLIAGSGIGIAQSSTDLTFTNTLTANSAALTGSDVFINKTGNILNLRKIAGSGGTTVTQGSDTITITSTPGEIATMSNLGASGAGTAQIFAQKLVADFQLRRLVAGSGISLAQNATDITITSTSGGGSVTSVAGTGLNGISVTGGPITTTGTLTITLNNTAVTPGNYVSPTLIIDQTGRITSAVAGVPYTAANLGATGAGTAQVFAQMSGNEFDFRRLVAGSGVSLAQSATDITITATSGSGTVTSVAASGDANILVTGSPITTTGTLNFALSATGVSQGSYTSPNLTVDQYGRITTITNGGGGSGTVTSVGTSSTDGTVTITGGPITTSGVLNFSVAPNTTNQKVVVSNSGSTIGTRKQINFIAGANTTISATDNNGTDSVDVTIASTGGGGGSTNYSFRVNIDGSGFIDAVTPFANVPVGWSINRDSTSQFTITHNLGVAAIPVSPLTGYALNTLSGYVQKVVTGNPTSQYSMGISPTLQTITVWGVTVSNTQVAASGHIIYKVSF